MAFVDGFLGLCSAIGAGTVTELAAPGYYRQPIAFGEASNGISFSSTAYAFGMAMQLAGVAGRAIFDAPTGGNLLLILPFPTPISRWRPAWDSGDAGALRLQFTALAAYARSAAFSGTFAAATAIGACSDSFDVINPVDLSQSAANPQPLINTAVLSSGVALTVTRGVLRAT